MLMIDETVLSELETTYPGIRNSILSFETAAFPVCLHCGSSDTADVQVGLIGRTLGIAAATTRFKLIPNGVKPDKYFCNSCEEFFAPS